MNATIIGSTPFQASQFTTYFKILKATHQLMAPGQIHIHRVKFTLNRVLNGEEEVNSNGNIKGFTIYTLMVMLLQPVMERLAGFQENHIDSRVF